MNLFNIFLVLLTIQTIGLSQPHINVSFENREMSGNTWSFDLVAQILPTYLGSESNWSGANVRTNIEVPSGVTIISMNGSASHPSVQAATGQSSFGDGSVAGTIKYGIFLERNSISSDFIPGSTVTLASMSVTFSAVVPNMNLVTPRPFGSTAQSFWNTLSDPTARPFGLPAAFPLPIKLHTFSAEKDGDRSARLDWTTSSEINSAYFGIERSKDGSTWERIGQVAAAGNSQSEQTYTYVDRNLPMVRDRDNVYYYRLQMTDLDGAYSHSDIRGVNLGKLAGAEVSIYPNPTVDVIHVDVSGISLKDGDVSLSVYDMNGRNMVSKNIIGTGIEVIDAAQYPAGTYDVVVKQGPDIYQKKVIKID